MASAKNIFKSKGSRITMIVLLSILIIGIAYYIMLPPINLHASEFWSFLFFAAIVVLILDVVVNGLGGLFSYAMNGASKREIFGGLPKRVKIVLITALAIIAILLILHLFSSEFLRAGSYSSMVELNEMSFAEGVPESTVVSDIALMDSVSTQIIGNRTLGALSDLVSQFVVASDYTQLAVNSVPVKVAPLEYASFFKWWSNRGDGIPGYVKVDPVNFEAEFVRLEKYIKISPSAYFSSDLQRTLRFKYPFEIFDKINFEIDEQGNPYWICPTMKPRAGWFGGFDVSGVVILDAVTGESTKYNLDEIPDWIDIVYNGNLICQKYDWHGGLSGGYINYMFSQTGCTATTDDFGYKIIGNDVYIYTGVTSLSNDAANIGFILVNSRTGEYRYFPVAGAEEHSAMSAAEGAVQQFGYGASFPSLINVNGEPTYIMVLKDASQIVKLYSMVNVANYNIVVTADSQEEVYRKYIEAMDFDIRDEDEIITEEEKSITVTVKEKHFITFDGNTVVYVLSDDGIVFKFAFDAKLFAVNAGDVVNIKYYESKIDNDGVISGNSYEIITE